MQSFQHRVLSSPPVSTPLVSCPDLESENPTDSCVSPVHFGGGTWGVISVTFLDTEQGLFYVGNRVSMILIGWNLCGLVVITVWTVLFSGAVFGILYCLKFLRVPPEVEKKGNLFMLVLGSGWQYMVLSPGLDFSRNGGARANALDRQWRKAPSKSTSSTPPPSSTASRQDIGVTRDYSVTSLVQLQTGRTVVLANHARCPEAKTVLAESDEDGRSSPVVTGDGCGDDPISAVQEAVQEQPRFRDTGAIYIAFY